MRTTGDRMRTFLIELMSRRQRLPSQLAADLDVSHATVLRWLSGEDMPSPKSCQKLSAYSGFPLEAMLGVAGHIPDDVKKWPLPWPDDAPEGKNIF